MKLPTLFALTFLGGAEAFNRLYPIDATAVGDTSSVTTEVIPNNAFGECKCDLTLNSCDVYCCCDDDCNADILAYWKENYNDYCARNSIL